MRRATWPLVSVLENETKRCVVWTVNRIVRRFGHAPTKLTTSPQQDENSTRRCLHADNIPQSSFSHTPIDFQRFGKCRFYGHISIIHRNKTGGSAEWFVNETNVSTSERIDPDPGKILLTQVTVGKQYMPLCADPRWQAMDG